MFDGATNSQMLETLQEQMSLKNRVALVTGAAGAIGSVISETLAELGSDLVLVDRQEELLEHKAQTLANKWNIKVESFVCDLESSVHREELLVWLKYHYIKINILINNAAFVGTSDLQGWACQFEEQSLETWRRAIEVNLTAAFDLCKGIAPLLKKASGSNIINIGSIYGELGPDWHLYEGTSMGSPAAYAASKGGLIQLTRWLATTLAPQIRVNAISPGGVFRNQPEVFIKRYEARVPLGRMATEKDFRGAVAYLASGLSSYVTGQNLLVDGGWGIW